MNYKSFKLIFVIFAIFIIIILLLFFNYNIDSIANNSMSNIRNAGYIARNGNYIYFTDKNNNDFLSCYNIKTNELTEKISYTYAYNINVAGSYIYYNGGSPGRIYKLKQGKKYPSIITTKKFYDTIVTNNYIYAVESKDREHSCIYRMNLNGFGLTKVIENSSSSFDVKNDIIYFANPDDNYCLYSCDNNGNNLKKLSSVSVSTISVYDQSIYFIDIAYEKLYRADLNGTNEKLLYDDYIKNINVFMNGIVFNDDTNLYISDLNCSNIEILSKGIFDNINVFENNIIYKIPVNDKYNKAGFYMMNIKEKKEHIFAINKLLSEH